MSNSLTGDFPAIFQVSRGTINRLLASMHQNAGSDSWTPSFPHSVQLRVGQAGDDLRGIAQVQLGVPRIELQYGSTDRFLLHVGVRAHYEGDFDSVWTLAEFINGTLTAEYALTQPDPSWPGWSEVAVSEYVAIRAVEGSVGFSGTTDAGWSSVGDASPEESLPEVAEQIAQLLRTSFQATPLRAARFGPGRLRSLGSAVAGPVDLDTASGGRIESIDEEWLDGRDVGLAISSDFVLSRLDSFLAGLGSLPSVPVDFGIGSTVYRPTVSVSPPEWTGLGDRGSITVRIVGSATSDSVLPDVDVEVVQTANVEFQPARGSLTLTAGPRTVHCRPRTFSEFSDIVEPTLNLAVDAQVAAQIGPALGSASSALNGFLAGGDLLGAELRKLDRFLTVRLDEGIFRPDGIAVRGTIKVKPRSKAVVTFKPTADRSAFSALETWIPGGQVNKLHWTWQRPVTDAAIAEIPGAVDPSAAAYEDRFLLRGPLQFAKNPEELPSHAPLPGLAGKGGVILSVEAVAVDERSGELIAIETPAKAIGYGYRFAWQLPPWVTELLWQDLDLGLLGGGKHPHPDELTLGGILTKATSRGHGSTNTLIVTQGHGVTLEILETLQRALTEHGRPDAGLLTVTVFGEGESARAEAGVLRQLRRLENELGAPLVVAESAGSVLSDQLALPSGTAEPSHRLIGPGGGVTWMHDGALSAAELTTALNSVLISSPPPVPEMLTSGPAPGTRLWEAVGDVAAGPGRERHPAPPLGRHGDGPAFAVFVDSRSTASMEQLANLKQANVGAAKAPARVTVFVNGDLEEVAALNSNLTDAVDAIPDPGRAIAARLGVSCWPTTVMLDERGAVIDSWIGADATRLGSKG